MTGKRRPISDFPEPSGVQETQDLEKRVTTPTGKLCFHFLNPPLAGREGSNSQIHASQLRRNKRDSDTKEKLAVPSGSSMQVNTGNKNTTPVIGWLYEEASIPSVTYRQIDGIC